MARPLAPVSLHHPHVATAGIGLLFAALTLLASPWSYADALGHLARTGMADRPVLHLALIATLLASARLGGLVQGEARPRQRLSHCLRCFAGGALMAVGAVLVPGSNDSLLLDGAPRLQAHALLALPVMAGTIGLGLLLRRRFRL
jgi:toxin CptA